MSAHLKEGTVMIEVPETGVPVDRCLVCTGPKGAPGRERRMAQDALVVGMVAGIKALREARSPLCLEHETRFRETLAMMGCGDAETLTKLGVPFKVA